MATTMRVRPEKPWDIDYIGVRSERLELAEVMEPVDVFDQCEARSVVDEEEAEERSVVSYYEGMVKGMFWGALGIICGVVMAFLMRLGGM